MDDLKIPRQRSGYQLEDFGAEVLLYHFAKTQVVYLNETASLIWRLCDGQRNIGEIRCLLQDAYPQVADGITQDLRSILEQFELHGAIEMV